MNIKKYFREHRGHHGAHGNCYIRRRSLPISFIKKASNIDLHIYYKSKYTESIESLSIVLINNSKVFISQYSIV